MWVLSDSSDLRISDLYLSVSFIIAFDPFLVGDELKIKGARYRVREISLISCIFKQLHTGDFHSFQNKQLGASKDPIINLTRSGQRTYRFILYFQSSTPNHVLYKFAKRCSEKIKDTRAKELALLKKRKKRDYFNDEYKEIEWNSYCTFTELKKINYKSIMFKSVKLDEYGRKMVFIEEKFENYSWNVRTLSFNCITEIAHSDEFKEYIADSLPISMDKYNEIDRIP